MPNVTIPSPPDSPWFDHRPRLTERCGHCGGRGTVEVGYALLATEHVPDAPPNAILAMVAGTYDITTACKEASDIARKSGRPVAFEFLTQTVVVAPGDDADRVMRKWWQREYGETPEQTRAKR